jgi:hypothetical protein
MMNFAHFTWENAHDLMCNEKQRCRENFNSQSKKIDRGDTSFGTEKGKAAADATGDGSFCVKDSKGRSWLCFERRELTEEERMAEIMARVRGDVGIPMPAWIGEKGLRELSATSVEELRECLSKQR